MKKLLIMATLAVAGLSVQAQNFVGGKLGLQNTSNDKATTTSASIGLEMGHHFAHNWAICGGIGYTSTSVEKGATSSSFELSPFVRYTAARWGGVSFFLDGGVNMTWDNSNTKFSDNTNFSWGMGIRPGLALHVSPRVTLVANLGFMGYRYSEPLETIGFNFNTQEVGLGVHFNF